MSAGNQESTDTAEPTAQPTAEPTAQPEGARARRSFLAAFSADLAIDLGTANTVVYARRRGIVCNEPSVVARDRSTGAVRAVGAEAEEMVGRTPESIEAVRPLREGLIADSDAAASLLRHLIRKARSPLAFRAPRVVIGVPSGSNEVEKRGIREAALSAGAREVYTLQAPIAAAMGAGMLAADTDTRMVIDIGAGTTEIAMTSELGALYTRRFLVGGNGMDEAIRDYLKTKHDLVIGNRSAERIKIELGAAAPQDAPRDSIVSGRDRVTGSPRGVKVTGDDICEALSKPIEAIVQAVYNALESAPAELSAEVAANGVVLTGGGARLKGLAELLRERTNLDVVVASQPDLAVGEGCGGCLSEIDTLRGLFLEAKRGRIRLGFCAAS